MKSAMNNDIVTVYVDPIKLLTRTWKDRLKEY